MAQSRRSSGASRRSEGAAGSRAARPGRERREPEYDESPHSGAAGRSREAGEPDAAEIEHLQAMASELAPQLGSAAIAAIATAVLLPEFLPAVLIGAGATLVPRLLPGAGSMFRPLMKTMVRAGYAAFSTAQTVAAEAGEQMQDVIAEVQAERRTRAERGSHSGGHHEAETGATSAH